ncbi:MAG: short-chain dehydrogenase [Porticoccaceae bacterium]|nr:MAG: short-chain dehydrogenase [Porticoccaceae bacterium]
MEELRFDGRVAAITGAGRGLGRAYAELLAARGAKVVVNDPGVGLAGDGTDPGPAEEVVRAIRAAGGEAVANTDSIATPAGAKAVVEAALDHFGRIDVLIHNAGIVRRAPLAEMSDADFEAVLDVHLRGGFYTVREALRQMVRARYGRIVLAGSINGLYGNRLVGNYSIAKAGLIGLCNTAALEGAEYGIAANLILPGAVTRMAEGLDTSRYPPMDPELVAPVVAWLAHERCTANGEMFIAIAGRVARAFVAETEGVWRAAWTPEAVAQAADAIRDTSRFVIFAPVPSGHLDHLRYSFEMAARGRAGAGAP